MKEYPNSARVPSRVFARSPDTSARSLPRRYFPGANGPIDARRVHVAPSLTMRLTWI